MTADEYFRMPETTVQHNLIDGVLYMSPSPFMRHQRIVLELAKAVDHFAEVNGGTAFVSPMDCKFADGTVMQPDVGYVSPARNEIVQDHIMGAPDVVIEVLSKGTRRFDRMRKLGKYERNGVREAWLVDPDAQTVTVFAAEGGKWITEHSVLFGEAIPSGLLDIGAGGLSEDS
jgi:Uma2 family endonuclease